jgi:hypothetical protein
MLTIIRGSNQLTNDEAVDAVIADLRAEAPSISRKGRT